MNETTTRLHSSTEINYHPDTEDANAALVPKKLSEKNVLLSQAAEILRPLISIDTRLKEALKPIISDRSVLKPDIYHSILADTYSAVTKHIQYEKTEEAKEILGNLKSLLEENASLRALLNQYLNHIKKA